MRFSKIARTKLEPRAIEQTFEAITTTRKLEDETSIPVFTRASQLLFLLLGR
jgi:hypothetical protein